MLRHLIAFCLSRRPLALVAFAAFLGIGYAAFTTLNVEAYPDPAPPIIEIIAQYPGQSPEEVERYVTIPLEIAVASTPGLTYIRSNTVFALGFIRLQFEYGRDYNFVRQQVTNRLKDVTLAGHRPAGDLTGRRHQRNLALSVERSARLDLIQLKTLQDWVVQRKLRIVPGVADIAVLGGKTKDSRPRSISTACEPTGSHCRRSSALFPPAMPMSAAAPSRWASNRSMCAGLACSARSMTSAISC